MAESSNKKFDLEDRTRKFAGEVIDFVKTLKIDPINSRIIEQLVGSSGSVGANYCEAAEAESKKDFVHKMGISKKELRETIHWLKLLKRVHPEHKEKIESFLDETHQLLLIFAKIVRTSLSKI